ncbi:peptidoglycan-binding domain-containing protein [Streptomyces roseochromogenus]|uniref:peptidoglycan-binding domain-containing protein n=1 Tax=Streptomyces roseochromogenus TaxID=285450 RepID=UPI0004CF5357|nr:peptidoglycan-binding domain-containing protein [Streptomyces roseochromogenus]
MSDSGGHTCPECGAPRGPDRSPSCDCAERAAEALRETRTAEAAAAEDFDPLRIRPYVQVDEPHPAEPPEARSTPGAAAETTLPLRSAAGPSTDDLRIFEVGGTDGTDGADGTEAHDPVGEPPRRRARRTVPLSVAGAGVAVVAAAGFASGLFSYHTPSRDPAAQEVRESVPDVSAPGSASSTASPSPTVSRPPVPPSRFTSTPRPSPPPATPTSASPTPTPTPTTSAATSHPASPTPATTASAAVAPVLQRGDRGPQVAELQYRLWQLNLYDDQIDGDYTRQVEDAVRTYQLARGIQDDTLGVYGRATRKSLEAETSAP